MSYKTACIENLLGKQFLLTPAGIPGLLHIWCWTQCLPVSPQGPSCHGNQSGPTFLPSRQWPVRVHPRHFHRCHKLAEGLWRMTLLQLKLHMFVLTVWKLGHYINREVSLHIKRESVRVERDRRAWRHQNMCTLWHCSREATRHTSWFLTCTGSLKVHVRHYMNISVRDRNNTQRNNDR